MASTRTPLTRRRDPNRADCWLIYTGDLHVGTIARRAGQPHDQDPWQWLCGFFWRNALKAGD
jgi:hypothetical protein